MQLQRATTAHPASSWRVLAHAGLAMTTALWLVGCGGAAPAADSAPNPPAAATAEVSPEPSAGAQISDAGFDLSFSAEPSAVGAQALAKIELTSKAPFKCNDKYPYKFKPSVADGVSYPSEVMRGDAATITHDRVVMSVPFTATTRGPHTLSGTFSFSICTADQCRIEKRELSLQIRAE